MRKEKTKQSVVMVTIELLAYIGIGIGVYLTVVYFTRPTSAPPLEHITMICTREEMETWTAPHGKEIRTDLWSGMSYNSNDLGGNATIHFLKCPSEFKRTPIMWRDE